MFKMLYNSERQWLFFWDKSYSQAICIINIIFIALISRYFPIHCQNMLLQKRENVCFTCFKKKIKKKVFCTYLLLKQRRTKKICEKKNPMVPQLGILDKSLRWKITKWGHLNDRHKSILVKYILIGLFSFPKETTNEIVGIKQ